MHSFSFLGLMVLGAYFAGQGIRRLRLPSLIGYMLMGVILGPYLVGLLPSSLLQETSFVTDIALGFVAFSIGAELSLRSMKRQGKAMTAIILCESMGAFVLVFLGIWAISKDLPTALLFGAMAPASAPAGTVAVIQEYKAKGPLTKALYAVVGFDDGLAIVIFGLAGGLAKTLLEREATGIASSMSPALLRSGLEIFLSFLVGLLLGFLYCQLVRLIHDTRDQLIMVFGIILVGLGVSHAFHLSPILTNLVVGMVFVNTRRAALVETVTSQVRSIMPLLFVLFFSLAGAHLNLKVLPSLGAVGLLYVVARTAGKMIGAGVSCWGSNVDDTLKRYLGLGILSQAGVAIGLALLVQNEFSAIESDHAQNIAASVITTIAATSIVFEIVGPICTKIALTKAGEITPSDA